MFDAGRKKTIKMLSIKIYRTRAILKQCRSIILGDHRFENVRHDRKNIVLTLAKEFQNLKRVRDAARSHSRLLLKEMC
ncbi:MAG: hypothetical protein SRB1_01222 [Desulfobacteraceae bacterium Eth-SRB1]|nr:MAG: hypothetical protein SRB1_01222 [Desulfobacteraceae bacterium Eth-SRB1]